MMTDTDQNVEQRIRDRAHRIWEEEGCPEGREQEHWERAKLIVTMEDAQPSMLKPAEPPQPESVRAAENLGEEDIYPHLPHRSRDDTD